MHRKISRRTALATVGTLGGGLLAQAGWLDQACAGQVDRAAAGSGSGIRITGFDYFRVEVPWDEEEIRRGKMNRFGVVRITTTDGITGYAFGGLYPSWRGPRDEAEVVGMIRELLMGADPFAVERLLGLGLIQYGGVEHALWDIIGKAAGQPVHRLLGGSKDKTRYYITMVWSGKADQSHLSPEQQAEDILWYDAQGYHAIKIRAWRENILDDVRVAELVMAKASPGFRLMFDRTAEHPGWVWSYEQAEQVARGLQEAGVYWLEEPFEVGDRIKSARLTKSMDMLITGGEHDLGVRPFAEYLADDVFDIIQPDGFWSGGILTIKKIGSLAAALGKPCILHGCQSLTTFGWLQANAALTNCEYQELGLIRPRIVPHEQWEPGVRLLNTPYMFQMDKEYITIPQGPGLGMDVNEDALEEYRQRR